MAQQDGEITRMVKSIQNESTSNTENKPNVFNTGLSITPTQQKPSFYNYSNESRDLAFTTLDSGEKIAKYETYIPGVNNEEYYANQQSTSDKWINGLTKFGLKTGTAVIGGTLGVVDSVINGVKEGSLSAAYNSDLNKWLDDVNIKLDYKLPNYYTAEEKTKGFGGQLTTANLWADKVLGGLSFTAGAIVSEGIWAAATGGVSLLAEGGALAGAAKWGTNALTKGEQYLAKSAWKRLATEPILDAAERQALTATLAVGEKSTRVAKLFDTSRYFLTSAGYESGVEARQYMKQTEADWVDNFKDKNGRTPTSEEYANFKDGLSASANAVFAANLAIVGSSNLATIGRISLGKDIHPELPNSWFDHNLFGVGFKKGAGSALEVVEATGKQKAFGRLYGVAKLGATEGLYEEGLQSVASRTAEDYIKHSYDQDKLSTNYGIIDALHAGFVKTYGTKEGWNELGVAILTGIIGGGAGGAMAGQGLFNEVGMEREQVKQAANFYNEYHSDDLIALQKSQARAMTSVERSDSAKSRGDLLGEVNADREAVLAVVERQHRILGTEDGKAQYKAALGIVDDNQLARDLGIKVDEVKDWKEQKYNQFVDLSDTYAKNARYVDSLLGDQEIKEIKDKETLKRALTFTLTMGNYAQKDETNITETIKKLVGEEYTNPDSISAIDTDLVLDKAGEELSNKYNGLNQSLSALQAREKALLSEDVRLQNYATETEATQKAQKVEDNRVALLETQEQIAKTQQEKQVVADTINLKNNSNIAVTVDMLDKQSENLGKLKTTLETLKDTNPQKFVVLQKLIQAQSKAIVHTKSFNQLAKEITDPNTRVTVVRGLLDKLIKARKGKDDVSFFLDSMNQYIQNQANVAAEKEAVEVEQTTVSTVEELRPKPTAEVKAENKIPSYVTDMLTEADEAVTPKVKNEKLQELLDKLKAEGLIEIKC